MPRSGYKSYAGAGISLAGFPVLHSILRIGLKKRVIMLVKILIGLRYTKPRARFNHHSS